jgi:hypothetical protein
VLGLLVTYLYDNRGLDRIEGDLLAYINRAADEYIDGAKSERPAVAGATPPASG